MEILELQGVSLHYEGQQVLENVGFTLVAGEILCLLGPSGSGKTSLLRVIAGLENESSGAILFQGKSLAGIAPHKRNFGMMFQEYALFPHKNVYHNIAFGLEMQKCSKAKEQERVGEMLELVGLSGFEERRVDELSGGERQRVALARSLAPSPKLLLLDEPLGSLDRELRERLTLEIRAILKKAGVTAIFVTHDQAEAFTVADRIAVIQDGVLQQLSKPEELYRKPVGEQVARFLGLSNIVSGHVEGDGVFWHPAFSCRLDPEYLSKNGEQLLLIRPEGASLIDDPDSTCLNIVTGKVITRQFLGGRYRLTVQVAGIELVFELPLSPRPPETGMEAVLQLESSAIVLLENDA